MTLAVHQLPSPHTGDRIEQLVCRVLDEWSILPEQISAILTDNGSNMVCAFCAWVDKSHDVSADDDDKETKLHTSPEDDSIVQVLPCRTM